MTYNVFVATEDEGKIEGAIESKPVSKYGANLRHQRINRPVGSFNRKTLIIKQKLIEAADEQVKSLLSLCDEMHKDTTPCPMCGRGMLRNEDTRLRAILAVLDRAGMGPTQKLELEKSETDTEWMQYATDEELVEVHVIMERAKSRAANVMELEATDAP